MKYVWHLMQQTDIDEAVLCTCITPKRCFRFPVRSQGCLHRPCKQAGKRHQVRLTSLSCSA